MAENCYSFGKLPKGAFKLCGGYYRTDPRPPTTREMQLFNTPTPEEARRGTPRSWRLTLATDAPAGTLVKVLNDDDKVFETLHPLRALAARRAYVGGAAARRDGLLCAGARDARRW